MTRLNKTYANKIETIECDCCGIELEDIFKCAICDCELNINSYFCNGFFKHYCESCSRKVKVEEEWEKNLRMTKEEKN